VTLTQFILRICISRPVLIKPSLTTTIARQEQTQIQRQQTHRRHRQRLNQRSEALAIPPAIQERDTSQ